MGDVEMASNEWLSREDSVCRHDRLARLDWLASEMPVSEYLTFPGGLMSKCLFEEARYCFVYGQFLATIVLGMAYIEHTLAGLFYAAGRNDLERASVARLLQEAVDCGWLAERESDDLEHARRVRNPVSHFRRPLHTDSVEWRGVTQRQLPYAIIEEDARHVMEAALRLLSRSTI